MFFITSLHFGSDKLVTLILARCGSKAWLWTSVGCVWLWDGHKHLCKSSRVGEKGKMYMHTKFDKLKEKPGLSITVRGISLAWLSSTCPLKGRVPSDHLYPLKCSYPGLLQSDSAPNHRALGLTDMFEYENNVNICCGGFCGRADSQLSLPHSQLS